jgi:hypothetical protein
LFGFLHSLFSPGPVSVGRTDSAPIRAAVEHVVDKIDPRLRAVPHYRRILSRPVERAVDYLTEHVNALPEPIAFDRQRYTADPRLRALFVGPRHLLETLSFSPAVRGYLQQTVGRPPTTLYAALHMERTEKTVLGMALVGDRVMRDVPQTAVNFHNHTVELLSDNELETRRLVQGRAFDRLIGVARQHLASIRARRDHLDHQRRRLLQGRISSSAAWAGQGIRGPGHQADWLRTDPDADAKLRRLEDELGRLSASVATIADQLALVARVLNEAGSHLRLDRVSLTLDHMNIKVPGHTRKPAATMTFNEMLVDGQPGTTIELIQFPSKDLLQPVDLLAGAQRALGSVS